MNVTLKIISAIGLFLLVYFLALMVIPSLCMLLGLPKVCPWLLKTGLASQATFLVAAVILIAAVGKGDWARYGMQPAKARPVIKAVLISAVAMLILMSPMVLMELASPPATNESPGVRSPGPQGMLQTIVFIWLIASICEEVFYRGFLQGHLAPLATTGVRVAGVHLSLPVALCAVCFGLGHLCLWGMVPNVLLISILISTTIAGLVAGYYREQTGSLLPAIAAHMTFNIVGTMVPLLLHAIRT